MFTRDEGLAEGWTRRRLDLALRRGHLARIAPGVYSATDAWEAAAPWDRHLALATAASRVTPDAIISHTSAAALLGLPMPMTPPERATMTVLCDTRTSREDAWRRFHRGETPPGHVWIRGGTPFLVPARTVLDCARELGPSDALAVMDAALRRGLVTRPGLEAMREHQRRWPGIAVADALLELADARRETWLESVSAWAFHELGLPPGVPQVVVRDLRGRFLGRVDVGWEAAGVVGEADGRGKYLMDVRPDESTEDAAARAVVDQGVRESRLRDTGLEVVRWDTGDALRRRAELGERWSAAGAPGRRPGGPRVLLLPPSPHSLLIRHLGTAPEGRLRWRMSNESGERARGGRVSRSGR